MKPNFHTFTIASLNSTALLVSFEQWGETILRLALLASSLALAIEHVLYMRQRRLEQRRKPRPLRVVPFILGAICLSSLSGCTLISSSTYAPETGKKTTQMHAVAFWDSSGSLSKFCNRATQGTNSAWTPGTYIGSAAFESHGGTNVAADIGTLLGAAIKASH